MIFGPSTFVMGRIPWLGFLPNASSARRPRSATRRFPSPRPSPSGRGWHAPLLAGKPAAGLAKVAFAYDIGDKTCSFSPRERVRMRGKAARHFQAASGPASRNRPGFNHYKHRRTLRIVLFQYWTARCILERPCHIKSRICCTRLVDLWRFSSDGSVY